VAFKKIFAFSLLAYTSLCYASHGDLTLDNQTNFPSTSKLIIGSGQNGVCSNAYGDLGITQPHKDKKISKAMLDMICMGHGKKCRADVYLTDDCSGTPVALIVYDTNIGFTGECKSLSNDYVVEGDSQRLEIRPR